MTLAVRTFETPHEGDLGLRRIANQSGLAISVLPNGCVFAIEHRHERGRTLINQVEGSPLDGGIARLYLRIRAAEPAVVEAVGPGAQVGFGAAADRFTWDGATGGVRHRVLVFYPLCVLDRSALPAPLCDQEGPDNVLDISRSGDPQSYLLPRRTQLVDCSRIFPDVTVPPGTSSARSTKSASGSSM